MYPGYLSDVEGILVGHEEDPQGGTGVTVIVPPRGNTCSVDVRGGAPGTRECVLLGPEYDVSEVHAIVLAGGSAYGLEAASGVMKALRDDGIGFDVGVGVVPIVPASVLFDLTYGSPHVWPTEAMGRAAYEARSEEHRQGSIGAGTGCVAAKVMGLELATKSGLGSASLRSGELVVSALVCVNALGNIYDPEAGVQLAGPKVDGEFVDIYRAMEGFGSTFADAGKNTTIGVIATNAKFDKTSLKKLAGLAHNGYARSIIPVHTMLDGDSIYALSTGKVEANLNVVGTMAARVMSRAIANAIELA
ncbi:MAG: P1 family peptidase [Tissierellia bacterium]|nr:P1 family peptidase [Tissierellia bacterium]